MKREGYHVSRRGFESCNRIDYEVSREDNQLQIEFLKETLAKDILMIKGDTSFNKFVDIINQQNTK